MMPCTVRPLDPWTAKNYRRRASPFTASWTATLQLLDRELRLIGANRWVLQLDVSESQIRNDGGIYARATPIIPAVRVAFDSTHGPLIYACDRYTMWQDNVRAIALSLEALRKVDRYGVAGAGEQYRGWTAISNRPAEMTREQAAEFIAHWAELGEQNGAVLLTSLDNVQSAYRMAAKRAHPDVTRDDGDTMARLTAARDLLLNGSRR